MPTHTASATNRTVLTTVAVVVASLGLGSAAGATTPAAGDDPTGLGPIFSAEIREALEPPNRADDPTGLGLIFSAEIAAALAPYAD